MPWREFDAAVRELGALSADLTAAEFAFREDPPDVLQKARAAWHAAGDALHGALRHEVEEQGFHLAVVQARAQVNRAKEIARAAKEAAQRARRQRRAYRSEEKA